MNIMSNLKRADFMNKFLSGETDTILPYEYIPQKLKTYRNLNSQNKLLRVSPEEEGVPSEYLANFYKEISASKEINAHGLMILRNGKIISLGMWKPFSEEYCHITYSLCKSITAMAIGIAVDNGLLNINEKIVSIFPERVNILTSKKMKNITVEHLLTMTSGVQFKEIGMVLEKDWVKAFMDSDVKFEPGKEFEYNSMNTYMLSAILKRKSGEGLLDYLRPRLFEPLGIEGVMWEKCPNGIEKGGWGCFLTIEQMAKLGELCLRGGSWKVNNKEVQLISREWIESSTREHIRETGKGINRPYGYQIWMSEIPGAYQFNGMFGQYVIVLPKHNMVIAMTSGSTNLLPQGHTSELVNKYFNNNVKFSKTPLEENKEGYEELNSILSNLTYGNPVEIKSKPKTLESLKNILMRNINKKSMQNLPEEAKGLKGKVYEFRKPMGSMLPLIIQCTQCNFSTGIEQVKFLIEHGNLVMYVKEKQSTNRIQIGFDEYLQSTLDFKGEVYTVGAIGSFAKDEDDNLVLKLSISFLEMASTRTIKLFFIEDNIIVKMDESPSVAFTLNKFKPQDVGDGNTQSKGIFIQMDEEYNNYRIERIATPTMVGTLKK